MPMDIEWAKDGESGELFVVQARPETVQSRREATALKTYRLNESGTRLVTGLSIGDAIATGAVCRIEAASQIDRFEPGSILVTDTTDPDWVPIMRQAAGIVTDHGGRTSHAAIVSRELGVPAVVGTGNATEVLSDGQDVTLSCAEGDEGYVYDGRLDYEEQEIDLGDVPSTQTRIMVNIASPAAAMRWWRLPCRGVGLARMEYIINNVIKIHPMALVRYPDLDDAEARDQIEQLTRGYDDKPTYFVDHLAWGIATIAATQHPDPVIVRLSDFKTNEYANLIGGAPRATTAMTTATASRWSAGRCAAYGRRWASPMSSSWCPSAGRLRRLTRCWTRWPGTGCGAGSTACRSTSWPKYRPT
jgi:pyruvate,water dikinase